MKANHLALPSTNVPVQQDFYMRYFGFRRMRGDGFLINDDNFVLVLEPAETRHAPPPGLHHGFFSESFAEVRELYEQMRREGVSVGHPPEQTGPMLTFFCKDPEGYEVEVRALEAAE
ncbi:MAG: Glyoxalase/bleomycin resistance protein/dioxygenase [Hyphomicrobiales bacterium]|nr:Glyoxalase/bleomycin resistance protein/dioxygenase [Hyphomicrobiales bacterium]